VLYGLDPVELISGKWLYDAPILDLFPYAGSDPPVVAGLPKPNFEQKQSLLRLIERVVITAGQVTIKLAIPLSTNLDLTPLGAGTVGPPIVLRCSFRPSTVSRREKKQPPMDLRELIYAREKS